MVLAKRTPVRTFLEITLPVFFGFLLLVIRYLVTSKDAPAVSFLAFSVDQLPTFPGVPPTVIGYAPNTTLINAVMARVATRLELYSSLLFTVLEHASTSPVFLAAPYVDEQALVKDVNKDILASSILGGVVFTNLTVESNITYKIRLAAQLRSAGAG